MFKQNFPQNFNATFIFRHVNVSDCGEYLIVCPQEKCRDNLVYFSNLSKATVDGGIKSKLELTQVVYKFEHDYEVIIYTLEL